jgi:hypothetical protein
MVSDNALNSDSLPAGNVLLTEDGIVKLGNESTIL